MVKKIVLALVVIGILCIGLYEAISKSNPPSTEVTGLTQTFRGMLDNDAHYQYEFTLNGEYGIATIVFKNYGDSTHTYSMNMAYPKLNQQWNSLGVRNDIATRRLTWPDSLVINPTNAPNKVVVLTLGPTHFYRTTMNREADEEIVGDDSVFVTFTQLNN